MNCKIARKRAAAIEVARLVMVTYTGDSQALRFLSKLPMFRISGTSSFGVYSVYFFIPQKGIEVQVNVMIRQKKRECTTIFAYPFYIIIKRGGKKEASERLNIKEQEMGKIKIGKTSERILELLKMPTN